MHAQSGVPSTLNLDTCRPVYPAAGMNEYPFSSTVQKGDQGGAAFGRGSRQLSVSAAPLSPPFCRGKDPEGGAAAAGEAGLESIANNSSAPPAYRERFRLLDWLRRESVRPRQRQCMSAAVSDTVSVVNSPKAGIRYSGVQTCGSITCPYCGPRIGQKRREEITAAVDSHRYWGGKVLFGTLTLKHDRSERHEDVADAVASCWAFATDGRGWARDKRDHGIIGTVRVWETTWTPQNGWHVHVHVLLFLDGSRRAPKKLLGSMFKRWRTGALRLGRSAPLLIGQDLHEVTGEEAGEQLGGYFAKEAIARGRDEAEAMGWELTHPDSKTRSDSATPAEILELASYGVDRFKGLWAEFEKSMKGRRTIAWSKGLRAELGLDIELSDEEIAQAEDEDPQEVLLVLPGRVFRQIARRPGTRAELLDVCRDFGAGTAAKWLIAQGYQLYDDAPPGAGSWAA